MEQFFVSDLFTNHLIPLAIGTVFIGIIVSLRNPHKEG